MIELDELDPKVYKEGRFAEVMVGGKVIEVTAVRYAEFGGKPTCNHCAFNTQPECEDVNCFLHVYLTKVDYLTHRLTRGTP